MIRLEGTKSKSYWTDKKVVFCEPDRLCNLGIELPRINYDYNGKYYQYVYGISQSSDGSSESTKVLIRLSQIEQNHNTIPRKLYYILLFKKQPQIIKIDVKTRESKEWERVEFSVSEPVFVAQPGSTQEDEGIILFSALDRTDHKRVLLVILDAATLEEKACVEFIAKGTVTKDFHGIFSRDNVKIHRY